MEGILSTERAGRQVSLEGNRTICVLRKSYEQITYQDQDFLQKNFKVQVQTDLSGKAPLPEKTKTTQAEAKNHLTEF